MSHHKTTVLLVALAASLAVAATIPQEATQTARQILQTAGVKGGFVIHVGCGTGELTAALRASDSFIVQGLDPSAENVQKARAYIRSLGLYGKVSVVRLVGEALPYVDDFANLIVGTDPLPVPMAEVMRVLAPGGVALVRKGGRWTKTVKPRPSEMDEWTHYLHDATNNPVSRDTLVGPPRHLRWVGSPRWSRHHDRMASMSALVSANGRLFYIIDEGSRASIMLPSHWALVARDAFNGTILWKRRIPTWHTNLWPFKSGPTQLTRRLVAIGDRVYVPLGLKAPLSCLDAATGKTLATYEDTKATEEIIAAGGLVYALVNRGPGWKPFKPINRSVGMAKARVAKEWAWDGKPRSIVAIEPESGRKVWEFESPVVQCTLACDGRRLAFHDGERIVCLDARTGKRLWVSQPVSRRRLIPTSFGPNLILYRDLVLFSGGDRKMWGLSATDGKILWSAPHPASGHNSPEDLMVIDGLVWAGEIANGRLSGVFTGRDPRTGEVKVQFPPDVQTYWFHHRCYRSKATVNYILSSRTGIEFVDFRRKHWQIHHWVRGGCLYGIMPANGLVYAPMHDCACYIEAKLFGFNALSARSSPIKPPANRLEKGPAYDDVPAEPGRPGDWPTYRRDPFRSGHIAAAVPTNLAPAWSRKLGGDLTAPVIAGGRLYVAQKEAHTIHALDAATGNPLWSYTAGGRVDSPPTIYRGRVLFGCADGYVYCLRARDGALAWRFRAAPADRRTMAWEQIESLWPVNGSVLVQGGVVYCVAGRSLFIDGGMRLVRLDPQTGRLLSETILDDRDPETGKNLQVKLQGLNMPPALPDILSSDGKFVYMRSQKFDLSGKRLEVVTPTPNLLPKQKGEDAHLFATAGGFLDGSWFHRSYWIFGRVALGGAGGWPRAGHVAPAGRIMAFDDQNIYGYGRQPTYFRWTTPLKYHLFSTAREPKVVELRPMRKRAAGRPLRRRLRLTYRWSEEVPVVVRAMVLAATRLFIAGPPAVVDEEWAFDHYTEKAAAEKLAEQDAALAGKRGALLWVVDPADGKKLAELKLASPPTWDGMAAARGRLYLTTMDGSVVCLAGQR